MTSLPLLLVPGLMNDERVWKDQVDVLGKRRPVWVADAALHDSVQALAAAALGMATTNRFALAGFSLGGYVALEMMRQAPERIAALALVDTGARADTPEATTMRRRMLDAVEASAAGFDAVAAAFLPRVVHPSRVGDADIAALLAAMAARVGTEGFRRQQRAAIGRPDSRASLAAIDCPTLVLCGREDQTTPLPLSEEMAAMIPGARLVVVDTCGHMAPLERPDAVTSAIVEWLSAAETIEGTRSTAFRPQEE